MTNEEKIIQLLDCIHFGIGSLLKLQLDYFKQGGTSMSKTVTLSPTAVTLAEKNPNRLSLIVTNNSISDVEIYFSDTILNVSASTILKPSGGVMILGAKTDIPYQGRVLGLIASGTAIVNVTEINLV